MKIAIYARVSTTDRDQNLDTQLLPLREYCEAQGWTIYREYADEAPAGDLAQRTAWAQFLDDASKHKIDLLLVWRLDRAFFRSVLQAANTLEDLQHWHVGFRSYVESWLDTTSPFGKAFYYVTAAYAELERGVIAERIRAGMERAKRDGIHTGRPRVTDRPEFVADFWGLLERVRGGEKVTKAEAARRLGIGKATLARLLNGKGLEEYAEAADGLEAGRALGAPKGGL